MIPDQSFNVKETKCIKNRTFLFTVIWQNYNNGDDRLNLTEKNNIMMVMTRIQVCMESGIIIYTYMKENNL